MPVFPTTFLQNPLSATTTPLAVSGAKVWLDLTDTSAATYPSGLGAQSSVINKADPANPAAQATSGFQPIASSKGLTFDGVDDRMTFNGTFLAGTEFTVFVVEQSTTTSNYFLAGTGIGTNLNMFMGQAEFDFYGNGSAASTGLTLIPGETRVWTGNLNSVGKNLYLNGVLKKADTTPTKLTAYAGATIGALTVGSQRYYNGTLKEIIIYNRTLTSGELAQVNAYLKAKHQSAPLLRVATAQNRTAQGAGYASGADRMAFRWPHIIAQDMQSLVVSNYNWWQNFTAEAGVGNAYTIIDACIELDGTGQTAPLTVNGGRSVTVADFASDIQFDPLYPAAFGLTSFPKGTKFWTKMRISVPAAQGGVPISTRSTADVTGSQAIYFANGSTSITSSTDAAGAYTTSGTAPVAQAAGYCPIILGTPVIDQRSYAVVGDSIAAWAVDNSPSDIYGQGFIQRSMRSAANDDPVPCINMARYGCSSSLFTGGPNWKTYVRYANRVIDEICTNDIGTAGTANVTTIQTGIAALYTYFRFMGVAQKIVRTKLLPRTTSTDAVATTANQTYVAGWGVGEASSQMNAWFDARLADGTVDAVVAMSGVRDTVDPLKWKPDASTPYLYVANEATLTHPSAAGHEAMAVELRAVVRSI